MLRLGIVGYGGRMHGLVTSAFRQVEPDLRVVAVVDPDEEGVLARLADVDAADVDFYADIDRMVRDAGVDALAIGTRCNLHARYAIEAAAFDLPLFLEKPVAVTMRQATALERAFEGSRCPVVVSFPLRVSPLCELAKAHIANGAVGAPVHVSAVNRVPYGRVYWEEAYRDYDVTGGLFLQKATHDFDYISALMNSPIVRVGAMATRGRVFGGDKPAGLVCSECGEVETCLESPRNRRRRGSGSDRDHACVFSVDCGSGDRLNEDCSSAVVEFASGAHGAYSQVFFSLHGAGARGATVSGYDGTLSFDWYTNELCHVRHHSPFAATERAGAGVSHFGGDLELAHDFIGTVKGRARARTPVEVGIQSVYACLAARESAAKGRFVKVRQVGQMP